MQFAKSSRRTIGNLLCALLLAGAAGIANAHKGEIFKLRADIAGFKNAGDKNDTKQYVAPKDSAFEVTSYDSGTGTMWVQFQSIPSSDKTPLVEKNRIYSVVYKEVIAATDEPSILSPANSYTDRWTHGALFVPFKFRLMDKSLTGDAAIGYYVGYNYFPKGVTFTPMMSFGLSQIAVPNSQDNTKTETKTGLTMAIGDIVTFKDNFQFAVVVGRDWVGSTGGQPWQYNGRTWVSFSVGYNFAR